MGRERSVRRTLRTGLAAALLLGVASVVAVLGFAGPAAAHVVVTPGQATAGGFARLSFQVPTESDTLSTTKVQVYLDTAHPIATVLTEPVPGWTVRTATTKLATPIKTDDGDTVTEAVSQITWTASSPASAIKPGQFLEFPVSLGALPDNVDQLAFKTLQTYSDGSVVRWIDQTPAGGPEPEHPAPVLQIQKAAAASANPAAAASADPAAAASSTAAGTKGSDAGALALGGVGAGLGLIGLVLGALALARTRNRTDAAT
jgi:periplasmic copper chaperone A